MRTANRPPAFWLFPVGLGMALGLSAVPGEWPLYVILAVSTAILGLPHGSLDSAVAKRHLPLNGRLQMLGFYVGYLALGGMVLAFWWQAPNVALVAFLLYSAFHFADDIAVRIGQLGGTAYGLWVLSLPVGLHPEQVTPLFEMLGATQAAQLVAVAPYTLALSGAVLAVCLILRPQRATSDWRDPLLLAFGAMLLHPLAYFIAYWCFLHSPRHLELAARDLGLYGWRERLKAIAPITLATYALALGALPFLIDLPSETALMRIVFIGLAVLTVPHMVLELIASPRRTP
ncbi:Brp/Blh family beta-carotene 15,15'-dioxygenase [Halomonas llamarensis]|uniref:Probable beta-carotene 15,15'-dioxygenase n=1 Tax=Halomonas llamarensis TaxID=2945104 RepID=A0ABT0SU89_9GAMM|nr:Brp/Blh family beta-carotene 15,15'-dioxygenase [Halomonas llamarensis]MCL7931306.1 Brp/Blh family beta-carotene 15,15'-dioxygenase [Halomonas llamarensis]